MCLLRHQQNRQNKHYSCINFITWPDSRDDRLGLYFLTLRTDSDLSRYIEANILQLTPAKFDVQTASYEMSETALGQSLLVTITINNSGQVEGAPEEMQIVLVDAQNKPIISWPLDTAGQIIAPGQSTQLYTRLFEPPEEFANLRVMVR